MSVSRIRSRLLAKWTFASSAATLCLMAASVLVGEGPDQPDQARLAEEEAKLELLSEKLAALDKELLSLDERQTTIVGALHRLEVQIEVAHQKLQLLKLQLERGYREIDSNLKQVQALEASIRELRPYLASRAVSLYKLGKLSYMRLLLSVEQPSELTRAYRYISRLARVDAEKIGQFLADQEALEETKADLLEGTRKTLETRKDLEEASRSLERRRATRTALLEEVYQRREMAETLQFELEDAKTRLTTLITDLAVDGKTELDSLFLPIRLFRGELGWPVEGRVGARFGKQRHPRFRTVTVQNGVEIQAPMGTTVRAVYDGEAVFASWFQGYGTLLIVSHPRQVHSLYGHLSEIKVREGDTVRRGDEVALVGDTGSLTGPSLYFEIREEGQPVNPEEWLVEPLKRTTDLQMPSP